MQFTDAADAPEKTKEEVRPGQPYLIFSAKPQLEIKLENPIPLSGLFTVDVLVANHDTTKSLYEKVAKKVGIKDAGALKLYRFEDPVMGPRLIPQYEGHLNGKVALEEGRFEVDVEKATIHLVPVKGAKTVLGSQMCYIVA